MGGTVLWTEPRHDREDVFRLVEEAGHQLRLGKDYFDQRSPIPEDELCELVTGADALLVGSRERFGERVLTSSDRLQVVAKCGIGVDKIDRRLAEERGILITNTALPEDFQAVAEGTVARVLALAKNLLTADRAVRDGTWERRTNLFLAGKTAGIVGFGRIGVLVATYLRALGCEILFHDPFVSERSLGAAGELGAERVELPDLLARADIVSLHALATPETYHLIDADALATMRPEALLVNTARGSLVDEHAVAEALRSGAISAAALDVFETEPLPPESPLLAADLGERLLLSPHTAARTPEGQHLMPLVMARNALDALDGKEPEFLVNPEAVERWRERFHPPADRG